MSLFWEAAGATDVGRQRAGNEDAFFLDSDRGVFIVADGMGGHAAGEVASAIAVRSAADHLVTAADSHLPPTDVPGTLASAFQSAWQEIIDVSRADPRTEGMGTTLTACLVSPDGWCRIGHIGDSRLYRARNGELELLTQDHTWVQREITSGRLQPGEAESHPFTHVLTRVLAADLSPEADLIAATLVPGDLLLLCTDGLHGLVSSSELREAVTRAAPLSDITMELIDRANRRGGRDNITALLVRTFASEPTA